MRMPAWSISLWSIAMVMRRIAVSNVLSMCTMLPRKETITISFGHLYYNVSVLTLISYIYKRCLQCTGITRENKNFVLT